jgi:DNA-binding protein HU-beta
MNWRDLLKEASHRSGVPLKDTRAVIEALVETVLDELSNGGSVSLRGLGTFSSSTVQGRTLRSVQSRRRMWMGAHHVPRFRSAKRLRAAVAASSDQSWKQPEHQTAWRLAETLIGDLDLYHSNQVPQLPSEADDRAVDLACADAFGATWQQARGRYEGRAAEIPVDYLALAASRRWGR